MDTWDRHAEKWTATPHTTPSAAHMKRAARQIGIALALVVLLFTGLLAQFAQAGLGLAPAIVHAQGRGDPGHPNTYQPQAVPTKGTPPLPKPHISGKPSMGTQQRHPFTPTMKPLTLALSATQSATASSSDGVVQVSVPSGAVSDADIAAAGGGIHLIVTQVAPASGSTTGGHISLGTYLLQLQNAAGKELPSGAGLRKNITLRYFWKSKHSPVPLDRFIAVINGAAPVDLGMPVVHRGKHQSFATTYDPATTSINAVVPLTASSSTAAFDTDSPEGFFGKADIFQNGLHTGSLSDSLDIAVPSGPGGLTPPLHLTYSSAAVNANTNAQAAASWVGEGWNLDLGEITWAEYNVNSASTTATWENAWSISDPFGASADLIPPNINVSTYYDDSPNPAPSGAPITWHTAPEMHAKIVSYTNPTVDCADFPQANVCGSGNYSIQPPCWRVWLPNGIMEEYGCTPDSLQWYPGSPSGTTNYPAVWKLDLITDPNGNQIHISYKRDMSTANGISYVRDIVLDHIEYDAPACHDANTMCTGAAWNPRMKVVFSSSNAVAYPYPGRSSCGPNGGLRCDDPAPQTAPNIGTPLLTPTQVLNSLQVQVYNNATWNTLRSYQFQYEQGPAAGTIADPITGNVESVNGFLLLDQFQEFGSDGTTTYPAQTFTYVNPDGEWYEDSAYHPAAGTPCGPSWNTGNKPSGNTGCALWWENFNIYYLSEVDNGQGAQQTFSWLDMRTNQHGVDAGQNALDPSYCTVHQSGNYPCDLADDNGWSHISLTSRTVTVKSPTSSNANAVTSSTWNYTYNLSNLVAQECGDCTVGFYWGNANNQDYLDYYEGKFMGYAFTQMVNPDNSAENDYFYATDGWGVYDNSQVGCYDGQPTCPNAPYWHTNNAASGHPYQVDTFGVQQSGTYPLMRRTLTTYTVTCPPSGVSGSGGTYNVGWGDFNGNLVEELNHNNPVASCDVQVGSTKTYDANGNNSPSDSTVPWAQTANSYNSYGQMTQSTITGNDLGSTSTIVHAFDYIWNDNVTATNTSATGTYIVDRPADAFTKDGSGTVKGCAYSRYDGMTAAATGQNSGLTKGLKTATDTYASCANKTGPVSPTVAYNANGDPLGSKDADAVAGMSGHLATSGACNGQCCHLRTFRNECGGTNQRERCRECWQWWRR